MNSLAVILIPRRHKGIEFRALIRKISETNIGWGAPRIGGEQPKLGINVAISTVAISTVEEVPGEIQETTISGVAGFSEKSYQVHCPWRILKIDFEERQLAV